ncbi:MAG: efflux RND transporter periplasmic adaptor subunit [Vicingus serpentipes]|nr:efflux RND transporter periplasmic adaptor subunit [Vicingus serpentipes]
MKKAVIYLVGAIFLVACGSSEINENVAQLQHKKDSLKLVYTDIAKAIEAIDEQLKALDTTVQLPLVTVNTIEQKMFEHFVEVQGEVEVGGNALVYPEVPGNIMSIRFKEGDKVNKGDLMIQLDASTLSSTIKEVETNYVLAKDIFEKQERLWKEKVGSEVQYLQAKTNKEALEQKLITLRKQLDMYAIRAPFSGVIDEINPKVGEAVNPAFPAARVINYNDTYLKADVSENYISLIKEGNKVTVLFPSLHKERITKIARVGNFINPNNRTFKINIDLNDFKEGLKPNLLADIKIRDFVEDTAIVIPSSIIQQDRQGNEYIYLMEQQGKKKTAKKTTITTGLSYQGNTIVLTGLKGGEKYIDKGARSIQDGELVESVKE